MRLRLSHIRRRAKGQKYQKRHTRSNNRARKTKVRRDSVAPPRIYSLLKFGGPISEVIHNPHDTLIKRAVQERALCLELFEEHLTEIYYEKCHILQYELVPTTHIDDNLRKQYTDVLFKFPLKENCKRFAYFYLLYEHQSTPDQDMPFRDLCYKIDIIRDHRRQTQLKDIPFVETVVIYNGEKKYTAPTRLEALMPVPWKIGKSMFEGFKLYDLNKVDNISLIDGAWYTTTCMALKHYHFEDPIRLLHLLQKNLLLIYKVNGFAYLKALINYLYQSHRELRYTKQDLIAELADIVEPIKEEAVSFYDFIKQSGVQEGLEQGREEGRLSTARKMLALGLDWDVIEQVTEMSRQTIEQFLKKPYPQS